MSVCAGRASPDELLERPALDADRAAAALGVPADELRAARAEHGGPARSAAAGMIAARGCPGSAGARGCGPGSLDRGAAPYRAGEGPSQSSSLGWRRAAAARSAFLPRAIQRLTAG